MSGQPLDPATKRRWDKAKRYLRLFLVDTPAANKLILGQENSDEMLTFALEMAISDWNSTNPLISPVTMGNYPSLYLLMHGAVIQIMKSQGIVQTRNQLSYQAGGSSFSRHDKGPAYQSWAVNFANEYEVKKRNIKMHCNVARGWGGANSEYDRIGYAW